jgi:hypothetical protein
MQRLDLPASAHGLWDAEAVGRQGLAGAMPHEPEPPRRVAAQHRQIPTPTSTRHALQEELPDVRLPVGGDIEGDALGPAQHMSAQQVRNNSAGMGLLLLRIETAAGSTQATAQAKRAVDGVGQGG